MGRWVGIGEHSEQAGQFLTDGGYELRILYCDPRQLVMDILHRVAEVEVVGPRALRMEIEKVLRRAREQHGA